MTMYDPDNPHQAARRARLSIDNYRFEYEQAREQLLKEREVGTPESRRAAMVRLEAARKKVEEAERDIAGG